MSCERVYVCFGDNLYIIACFCIIGFLLFVLVASYDELVSCAAKKRMLPATCERQSSRLLCRHSIRSSVVSKASALASEVLILHPKDEMPPFAV